MKDYQQDIRNIQKDVSLSSSEKTEKIKIILSQPHEIEQKSNFSETCSHYKKKCSSFQFECCSILDPCHRCHLERNTCDNVKILTVVCSVCKTRQPPSSKCSNCLEVFAKNYCGICSIWTIKNIFHCDSCGICRVGKKEDTFHCNTCMMCFKITNSEHVCLSTSFVEKQCVVCNEDIFNNQDKSFPLPCNHFVHKNCLVEYTKFGNLNCPYCKMSICNLEERWKSIRDSIQKTPVPKNFFVLKEGFIVPSKFGRFHIHKIKDSLYYGNFVDWSIGRGILHESALTKNIYVSIYCNDCFQKSQTLFHFYGLECKHCGSFNTQE
jgi:RING finger/CHY zinc finger protein 1